jgi:hypothetical protein
MAVHFCLEDRLQRAQSPRVPQPEAFLWPPPPNLLAIVDVDVA